MSLGEQFPTRPTFIAGFNRCSESDNQLLKVAKHRRDYVLGSLALAPRRPRTGPAGAAIPALGFLQLPSAGDSPYRSGEGSPLRPNLRRWP